MKIHVRMLSCPVLNLVAVAMLAALNGGAQTLDSFNPGANYDVYSIVSQPDGRIIVAGAFDRIGGGGSGTNFVNYIARMDSNGVVDTNFNPRADQAIGAVALQPDGKIIVGGDFSMLGGGGNGNTPRSYIGRLNSNGTLDTNFNPGANGACYTMTLQPDGKLLVAGDFTTMGGGGSGTNSRSRLARLESDGTLETNFDPGANNIILTFAVQADGKIVVGGYFTMLGGGGSGTNARSRIGRLNADGSIDSSFNPGANDGVKALAVQSDGKILMGGDFNAVGGGTGIIPRKRLARLDASGNVDLTFNPGANDSVDALVIQPDGKILARGRFGFLGGGTGTIPRGYIGRLLPNGIVDEDFDLSFDQMDDLVFTMSLQNDGKLFIGGMFTTCGTATRIHLARFNIGRVTPSPKITSATRLGNGHVLLNCLGTASSTNHIEAATVLNPGSFSVIASINADTNGVFQFEDAGATNFTARFYRLRCP